MNQVVLFRHGQTEWSAAGRHTSSTDLDLTAEGERQARAVGHALAGWAAARGMPPHPGTAGVRATFAAVLTSPRRRAVRTAELAGLTITAIDDDLVEWDYGEYEGLTAAEIRERRPDWSLWTDGAPGGETPGQVGARADRVLARIRHQLRDGDVAVVGHGHALRVLTARWLGLGAAEGALFRLDSARLSTLGFEHDCPVILDWNAPPCTP